MATAREIKRRIKSIKNTQQITKAMQMVAASKMRRAQIQVVEARPYAEKIREVLSHLAERHPEYRHPFIVPREVKRVGLIVISSDKGLCGPLNSNLLRQVLHFVSGQSVPTDLITLGRKARDFLKRTGQTILAEATGIADKPKLIDVVPAVKVAMDEFLHGKLDQVFVAYNEFINTMVQKPTIAQILPCPLPPGVARKPSWDYIYEPSSETVLDGLMPRYVEFLVYQSLLENIASEHSARMIAMKNATDSAKDIIFDLNLTYNKARQASITTAISEIAAGSAAVA